ncbi:hypothetical protein KUTeg_007230, partial [Tegillarca granosa]
MNENFILDAFQRLDMVEYLTGWRLAIMIEIVVFLLIHTSRAYLGLHEERSFINVFHKLRFQSHETERIDPEVNMNVRIPHGLTNNKSTGPKVVVFLQHGLLCSATNWVANLANESLAFLLADAGFDVWMGNSRGNTYSSRHVKYSPSSEKFWAFSWDEMAKYDIPAEINYILAITGQKELYYVGHSQGTLQAFALFSQNQEIAKKVKLFAAMGPVTTISYIESPIKYLSVFSDQLAFDIFGRKDFLPSDLIIKVLGDTVCKEPVTRWICDDILFLLGGYDINTFTCIYKSYTSSFTGTTPPLYNVSNMKTPVVLFWGDKDWLADPKDVREMIPKLYRLVGNYEIKNWNHLDFIWGIDAANVLLID